MSRNPAPAKNTPTRPVVTQHRADYEPDRKPTERELDKAVEDSFPASDPPAHSVVRPKDESHGACNCPSGLKAPKDK